MKLFNTSKDYTREEEYVLSYLQTRRLIGIFGILLPVILLIGSFVPGGMDRVMGSISQYYGTYMRDFFVGILCAIALFLFSYKGYNRTDNIAATFAAVFALLVVFFPIVSEYLWVQYVHLSAATLLFLTLAFISLLMFTKSGSNKQVEERKKLRNRIYRLCGWVMLACIMVIIVYNILFEYKYARLDALCPVFIFETIALFAFGISWLVKGRTLWSDVVS